MSQINCLCFGRLCGLIWSWNKNSENLSRMERLSRNFEPSPDWEIFSWAIFAPLNSYFMEKKLLAAPGTSLVMTQLTFSRSIRASSNSELSLFLAFSALLAFCEAEESASSVSASFWVSFFLQESISVKNNVMKNLSPLRGPRHDKHCFWGFELEIQNPTFTGLRLRGLVSRDITRYREGMIAA